MPNGNANPLTTCISELQVTISGIANTDTIEFLLTHNVQFISSNPAYSSSAYTGNNGIHKLQWIVVASVDTIKLMLRPISCKAFSDNASLLSSFVSFQCKAIQSLNSAYANYTGNGVTSSNNTVTYLLQNAEVSVLTNPFIGGVSYPSLVNASGNGATLVNRYTAIQWVNTDISDPFYYKFTQETDAIHNGLWAVIPGTDSILLSGVSTGATYTYRLDTFIQNNPNYLLVTGASTKVILLKQQVIRKCTAASSKTIAFAEWICSNCAPNPKTDTVQLNVTVITNTATPQLSFTVSPSSLNCDTSLVYDYRIRIVAPSVIFLDSIIIPTDTSYFTLDAFYLGALNNALLLNNSQYNIQTFGGYTQLRLKLGNLTAPPPGMFNTLAGLSGSYSYFLTDTLYAILKLRFKCDGNNNALKTCTQHQLRLAFGNAAIKYKALCTLLSNPSAPFSSSSIEIHAVSSYTGFIQGFIENTDIDLGASGAMPVGFKFTASDTLQNPFSIQAGQNNLLHCDSVTYYAYLQVPDHITINTFNFKSPDFIIDNNDVSVSTFNGYKHYIIQYGHALQTYNAINNTTYSPAKAHITFDAIYSGGCPFSPATFGIDTMFIQYRAQCGGCENCYRSLACQSVLLFVHCADICGNAVTGTEEVLLQRASFGWATRQEYLSGMVPYQAADLAALLTEAQFHEETHKVYACDSIWLHAQGFTVDTIDIYSLSFELSYMPPGGLAVAENIFNFMHGTATLISTNSTDTLQISLSNPVISIGYAASFDTLLILTFNLLTNQTSDSLLNQHSYHIYLDGWLRVMPPTTLAAGAYFIPQIRGEFVNTNSDPDNFLEHSCDPWGDLMTALIVQVNLQTDLVPVSHATSPSMFNISTPWPMMNACTARTRVGLQIDGGFGINTDDFPFEFRPQVFFETLPTITYPLSNLMMLSGASNFLPVQNYSVMNNTIQIPDNLRALEKADPLLYQSAFVWMLSHRRECYNEADTINFSDIVNRAYADTPCRVNMGWNDLVAPNYDCNNIPLQLPVIADTIITIADTTIFNIPFSYYNPGSSPQSPLPNVWFHYTASGSNGQQLPIDTANGSGNQVRLHNILNGYGYFMTNDSTYALVSTSGQNLRLKLPTPCAEGDTFTVTLRYGALCNDSLFAQYLDGNLLPDSQTVCNVCTRIITIVRAPSAAQLVDQSFTDSCGRIYWHLNVHNNSNAPLYTGTLILRHPLSLPYSAVHSSVSYNGTTQTPLAPASYSYLTWGLFPGDTLPALALNLPSTAADIIAPHDTAFYTLAFDVDCSFVAEQLQAMYAGFGLCENFFNFDTLTAVFFNNYGPDTCCTNSLEAFDYALINHCDTLGWLNILINDTTYTFTALLTNADGDTLYLNNLLTSDSLYIHYNTLTPGLYFLTIQNNNTFITYTMAVVVDSVDAALCVSCPCTPGINIGAAGDTVYLSQLISNNTLPADSLVNNCLSISGTLIVDENYYILNCTVMMNPFAEIVVMPQIELFIDTSHFLACDTMWKGIDILPEGVIAAKKNLFEDALHCIKLHDKVTAKLVGNEFHACHIGIKFIDDDAIAITENYVNLYVAENNFNCTNDFLKLPFTNDSISYCGIYSINHFIDMPDSNLFRNMRNGILAFDGSLYVTGQFFHNLRHNTIDSIEGFAIRLVNKNANQTALFDLYYQGTNNWYSIPNNNMQHCRVGIYSYRVNTGVYNARMVQVTSGIEIINPDKVVVRVTENNISSRRYGIRFNGIFPLLQSDVFGNTIYVNAPSNAAPSVNAAFGGIIVNGNGMLSASGHFNITDNTIELGYSNKGIFINSLIKKINITGNYIYMQHTTPKHGIELTKVDSAYVSCNFVYGFSADYNLSLQGPNIGNAGSALYTYPYPSAFQLTDSKNITFKCNTAERIRTGLYIQKVQPNIEISGNAFRQHTYGILSTNLSATGIQSLKGNTFDIDTLSGNRYGGFVSYNILNYFNLNNFTVADLPVFTPLRIGRVQSSSATLSVFSNVNVTDFWDNNLWFKEHPFSASDYACSDDTISCNDGLYYITQNTGAEQLMQLATDSSSYNWDAQTYLMQLIQADSTLLSDSLFYAYYTNVNNAIAGDYALVFTNLLNAHRIRHTDSLAISNLNNTYTQQLTSYKLADSLYKAQNDTGYLSVRAGAFTAMQDSKSALLDILTSIDNARLLKLDASQWMNNLLSTLTLSQLNNKTVNDLIIRLNKNKSFNNTESVLLYAIAMQCPFTGGSSIYTARSLYAMVNDNMQYNDDYLCANYSEGALRKEQSTVKETVQTICFPNPASDKINLLLKAAPAHIVVYNMYGQLVIAYNATDRLHTIDTGNWLNGSYIIQVQNAQQFETFKVNIKH